MARYIRDIELHIEEAEVKCEIEWLFRQMNFYQTTWKCEECFCANYKQYGITTMKKHLKELYFFTYAYENGVLHFEAWIREGKKTERGLTDFNTLRITKPYLDNIVELENRLLNKLSVESQWYQKNRVFLDTERKKYEHNEKWFHIIGISAVILFLLVGCVSFATLKASRVEENSDTKVQESIWEKMKEKIVTDRPDILPEEDSKEEKVIEEDTIKEESPQEALNEESVNEETEHETISVEVEDDILVLMQQVYLPIVEGAEETDEFAFIFFDSDDIPELLVDSYRQYAIYTIKDEAAYCMVQKNTSVAEEIYEGRGLVSSFDRWRGGGDEGSYASYFYQTGIDMTPIADDSEATLYFTYDAIYDEDGKYTGDAVEKYYYMGEEVQEKTYEQVIEEWKINRGSEYKEGCVNGIWPRTYSQSDMIYFFNSEVNEKNKVDLNADSLETIVKSSEWKAYQSVDDYGENGQKAYETDFIQSDGRSYNNGIRYALRDVLYDYAQTINKNLLSDYWFMERVTPIGNGYYNVGISQEAENIKINLLLNPEEQEYIVLYAICEGGDRVTYNDKEYFSQKEWDEYPYEYEGDISIVIDNPFLDVLEISTHTNVESALKTYLETNEYAEKWKIEEIYGYYALVDYLLVSENSVVWICLDMSRNEFTTETFVWEKDAFEEKEGKIRNPVPTQWQEEDIAYAPDDTIYHKTYYDNFVRGKIMGINYYPDINIREELKDYFLSEQDIERLDSLVEMFYDNRTIEMPEADLQELFQEQGYDIYFHSAEQGDINVRFVEIMERDGLSLYPIRVLIQTWNESSIYLQDITGPIPRKIRGLIAMNDMDTCKLIVHSSGVSKEFVSEEEISFWEYKGTYWVLVPLELEVDTSHAHNVGDMYPDLDRDKLFQATYYRDGIVYQPSIQNDGVNMYTFRLGKLEEVEENKSFRLVAVCEVEGQTVERENCYIQYEIK